MTSQYTLTDAFAAHHLFVVKMVHSLANRHADHDDIIGAVWEKATRWWTGSNIHNVDEARNYLASVIRSVIVTDWYFRNRKKRSAELVPIDTFDGCTDDDHVWEQVVGQAVMAEARRAIKKLDKKYQDVLECFLSGHNNQEGAALLGVPRSTYGQRLAKAQQLLQEVLRDEA